MDTYFKIREEQSQYCLLLADDDQDLYKVVSGAAWREVKDKEAVAVYKAPRPCLTVFVLDSHVDKHSVIEWTDAWQLTSDLAHFRVLVLFSGEPFNHPSFHRAYIKSGSPNQDIEQIITLLKSGCPLNEWPEKIQNVQEGLSRTIHRLENIFLPITLDAKTLSEIIGGAGRLRTISIEEKNAIEEILSDHFGMRDSGYLGRFSDQHNGTDIVRYVGALCGDIAADIRADIMQFEMRFEEAVNQVRGWAANHRRDQIDQHFLDALYSQLALISNAGNEIVAKLREIRRIKLGVTK